MVNKLLVTSTTLIEELVVILVFATVANAAVVVDVSLVLASAYVNGGLPSPTRCTSTASQGASRGNPLRGTPLHRVQTPSSSHKRKTWKLQSTA